MMTQFGHSPSFSLQNLKSKLGFMNWDTISKVRAGRLFILIFVGEGV